MIDKFPVIFLIILVSISYCICICNDSIQKTSLNLFYLSTKGDNWINNSNWTTNQPLSTWYGLTIDDNGCVSKIDLPDNNLNGFIDDSFGMLTNLTYINLEYNQLTGSLPLTLSNLSNIESLSLRNNYFEGLAEFLINYKKLNSLNIDSNHFTGSFTVESIYLAIVSAASNYFSGDLEPRLFVKSINYINIDTNYFNGVFPVTLSFCTELIYLNTNDNMISGTIEILPDQLEYFIADNNQLTGPLPVNLNELIYLKYLSLSDNFFSGTIPNITAPFLSHFYLNYNSLTGLFPFIAEINNMIELDLAGNANLTGSITNQLLGIDQTCQMRVFIISKNNFQGFIPQTIGNCSSLFDLEISGNKFFGTIPPLKYDALRILDIAENQLSGPLPFISSALQYLYVHDNSLTGSIDNIIYSVHLIYLNLRDNKFRGTVPSEFGNFLNLESLYLTNNLFEGTLPTQLCNLQNLRLLDINYLPMCVPACLTKAAYSVSQTNFTRCQSYLDLALCSLIKQTDVTDKLSDYIDFETAVYQSLHPFNSLSYETYVSHVIVTNAVYYIISFDEWTHISGNILICSDIICKDVLISIPYQDLPGINGNEEMEIRLSSFYIGIDSSDPYNANYWGYLTTVKAIFPFFGWKCVSPPFNALTYEIDTLAQYGLTNADSYASDLCIESNDWRGVSCTFVMVTSLVLGSYGISGSIPSSLGLLTDLWQLDLGFNSFYGSIPSTLMNLTNLQILDLSNNELVGSIPSNIAQLTQLQTIYFESNSLTGTIPESLAYLNQSLSYLQFDANKLTGKLSSELCSLSNAMINVAGNDLDCYEECWEPFTNTSLKAGDLQLCAPTNYPTSQPTAPTFAPTKNSDFKKVDYFLVYLLTSILIGIICLIAAFFIYRKLNSKDRKIKILRRNVLEKLPIHRCIINKEISEYIQEVVVHSSHTIMTTDYDGNNVVDLALKYKVGSIVITEILKQLLNVEFQIANPNKDFLSAWIRVIQYDIYLDSVHYILDTFHTLSRQLSECTDENGRSAVNIASPLCRQAIKESLYFLRRFDFGNNFYPTHISETSQVFIVVDTHNDNFKVALKFISDKNSYINEIRGRHDVSDNSDSVIPILESYNSESDYKYKAEIKKRNWDKFNYCIVLPAGEKNLGTIISSERIAAKDWLQIQAITVKLASSIKSLHDKGYIHGDLKPLNVMRVGNEIKLIDLDACGKISIDYYGNKYSKAYVPPEMLYKNNEEIYVKSSSSIKANISQDSWSLGIMLYELYSGMSFFLKDNEDNIDDESLQLLYDFDSDYKNKKLSKISNKLARNLVSLLLDKNPIKRLTMLRVLEHPFLTNKIAPRLIGEEAEYDVFISYRVSSDLHHAEIIYNILTANGIKVWWDKLSLLPGMNWENGFSDGLVKSQIIVPIISKRSLNNPTDHRSNITLLEENSPCDNVILEYELALEFRERGLLSHIYPVLIGDFNSQTNEYMDYFACGSYPNNVKNCIVKSIDTNVKNHLNRLGLGSRLEENDGIKSIIEKLFKSQGLIVKGDKENAFTSIVKDIKSMKSQLY